MKRFFVLIPVMAAAAILASCNSQVSKEGASPVRGAGFVSEYLIPARVVLTAGPVTSPEVLTMPYPGQVSTSEEHMTEFGPGGSVLLDFGKEIQGGIQITRAMYGSHDPARFRLVLGESVSEALSDVTEKGSTATNDHAVRDFEISVPWLGAAEYGNSGFRFARNLWLSAV